MKLLFKGVFGSHLYGLNTENSDKDYKAIYMPEPKDIILGTTKKNISHSTGNDLSKNSHEDVDTEIFSLQEFVKLACQGQTVAIDMLHTPPSLTLETSPEWEWLVQNRPLFYSKNMNAFMGYVKKQAAKYGVKGSRVAVLEEILKTINEQMEINGDIPEISYLDLPTTEYSYWETDHTVNQTYYVVNGAKNHDVISVGEFQSRIQKQYDNYGHRAKQAAKNEGIDWKAISHALRAGYQLKEIFYRGDFEYPLSQTEFILRVKKGKEDYMTKVSPVLETLVEELEGLSIIADLPDQIIVGFWEDWLYNVYFSEIMKKAI